MIYYLQTTVVLQPYTLAHPLPSPTQCLDEARHCSLASKDGSTKCDDLLALAQSFLTRMRVSTLKAPYKHP